MVFFAAATESAAAVVRHRSALRVADGRVAARLIVGDVGPAVFAVGGLTEAFQAVAGAMLAGAAEVADGVGVGH